MFYLLFFGWAAAWAYTFKNVTQKASYFITLLVFAGALWGLLNSTPVQNYLVRKVTATLSDQLHTTVAIKHVDFSLFNKMLIEGVLVKDLKKDTLLYAGTAKVNITDWFFIKDKATLKYLGLKNTVINLNRSDSTWNYGFLVDYFSSPKSAKAPQKNDFEFDFKKIELENFRFNQIDQWIGRDIKVSAGKMQLEADSMSLAKKAITINSIILDHPIFYQSDYTGNRPETTTPAKKIVKVSVPELYKRNNDGWLVKVKNIHVTNGSFQNEKETERQPYTDRFDGQHLLFAAINGD
ncbi:MAG: hypothetical protein WCI49_14905, partial [Ferruginibacter sp.]